MADQAASLEPFLILARSTKGAAAAKIILDVTAAPGVYVFSELLEMPNIQELSSDASFGGHFQLLQLFAYGTLQDYEENKAIFPLLKEAHINKLRQLTLISLASQHRSLRYQDITQTLQLKTLRQVEDIVIDTIYAGLLNGKLHHDKKVFHIDWVAGRDVREEDLAVIQKSLENWCQTAQTLLGALDTEITHLRQEAVNEASKLARYRLHRDEVYETVANELRNDKAEKSAKRGTEPGAEFDAQQWSAHGRGYEEQVGSATGAGATFGGKAGQNILQTLAHVGSLGGAFSGRKW
ncbi:conserved hypothetical protein [Cryptococcus deneoformans JEC21]|uniref:PCI domain-containing protein n=1 Tax=Cryptococcus deneoformans (strain JEC21 / ATCC MYA-565) TaxID=214684 RepID=Q5KBB3_CRYD1|nr:conserved hypothetical protein [Cryptococcus neoformans var. neoformans JEC21]AAW45331.2 conserved hypothetical protein [Cryptococcus neoformans var. neoformans JEC21]